MKKSIFILLSFTLLFSSCSKGSGSSSTGSEIKQINSETVYYQNGKESSFNGDVILYNDLSLSITANLGTVENGKLTITLPDLETIDGIPPRRIEKIQDYFDNQDFNVKVDPEDAKWFPLKNPLNNTTQNALIVVLSDDEEPNPWNRNEKRNIYYVLNLSDDSNTDQLILVFFTKDTTVKGKDKLSAFGLSYEYDVDIKVKRGWNKIYVNESNVSKSGSSIVIKSVIKSIPINKKDFKWTTSRTDLWL